MGGKAETKDAAPREQTVDDRVDEMQFATNDISQGIGRFLLNNAKTPEDVAAAIKKAPQYTRQIFLAANDLLGAQIAKQGVELAQSGDHSVTADNREALSSATESSYADKNAPNPSDKLPYLTAATWDGVAINKQLGQHDLIGGTDSDGARCAFATAMAMKILDGPVALAKWLEMFVGNIIDKIDQLGIKKTSRQIAAIDTISAVFAAIREGKATFGDLSWAQEGLHTLGLANDKAGTRSSDAIATGMKKQSVQIICITAAELVAAGKTLLKGERFLCSWDFDAAGGGGRHQLMIANHDGSPHIYDSEVQADGGDHLRPLDKTSAKRYFKHHNNSVTCEEKILAADEQKQAAK